MELLKDRLNKLTKTSNYRFKPDVVKKILEEFKKEFILKKDSFNKAVNIDKKQHPVYIDFEKVLKIIDKQINESKFILKFNTENIIDGYGNIAVSFNGNPYVTLELALIGLKTHNNMIFFSKKYYAINSQIIQILNRVCDEQKYVDMAFMIEYNDINSILPNQSYFDLMIYIGDKREYQSLKRKINIPTIFNGYTYVDVFVESKEYKELLLDMNKFGNENDIVINYFDNTSYDETLNFINKYEVSDCFVLLSKNTEVIYKFMSGIRANRFFINQNPFKNYEIDFDEKNLVYNKKIFMKKM